jgi:AAA+ ATPase superfamily predicted ATPase
MAKFKIGSPASPKELIDRKEELADLLTKMKSRSINYNVAVIGYRRIGKTSILVKLQDLLEKEKKIIPIYFDVQKNMTEPKIFFTRLQKTIFDGYIQKLSGTQKTKTVTTKIMGEVLSKLLDAFKSKKITSISAQITAEGAIIPKIDFDEKKPDYNNIFYSVFRTLKALSEEGNVKFVVILDEFQDFTNLTRYEGLKDIFNLFRAVVQERGDNVSYIISGSRVHMLNKILDSSKSPLFTHFEKITIHEMNKKFSIELFTKYLSAKKIKVEESIPEKAFELVGGNPFYLMALAEAWKPKEDIEETYHEILTSSLGSLKNYVDYILSEDLGNVKGGVILKTILRAVATSKEGLSYSEISHAIGVPMTKLSFYMSNLQNSDLTEQVEKRFKIRDRIIRDYLKIEAKELE